MRKTGDISATVRPIYTKCDTMMQNVSLKCKAVKIFNFKIPRWRPQPPQKSKNCNLMTMQNRPLKHISRLPSWIFKVEVLMSSALDRHTSSCEILWR